MTCIDLNLKLLSNLSYRKGEVYVCSFDDIYTTHESTALEEIPNMCHPLQGRLQNQNFQMLGTFPGDGICPVNN